ncbi:ABC transporter ATP-binding protein [Spiroplasma sp. TIUS-1]|nr:ABC transporter ATP-binding protein [Spiroplasma sp. TIUS-1]
MLKISELNKTYGKKQVLFDINLEINKGEFVGLIGNNGAGKTTLIKSIFGEIGLDSGSVTLNGEDVYKSGAISKMSFFPDSNSLRLNINLIEYLDYISSLNGIENRKVKIDKIIELLKLTPYVNKKLNQLSAGWKKRAIMAFCLINNPEIIIFDEPTANLDIDSKIEFLRIIRFINDMGITVVVTTHLIEELQNNINHLVILENGKIIYDDKFNIETESIKEIYSRKNNVEEIDLNELQGLFK